MAIEKVNRLVNALANAAKELGMGPSAHVIVRIGENGTEYKIDKIKLRGSLRLSGPELIIQLQEKPRDVS